MTTPPADFDGFAQGYCDTLDANLGVLGDSSASYAQVKTDRLLEVTARRLAAPAGLDCLDIGCGNGIAEQFLSRAFHRVVGIDVSSRMVAEAQARDLEAQFLHFSGGRIPFDDASFDVTFCFCVFHHVPLEARRAFVAEMCRVTRPGGLLFTFEHNPFNPITRCIVDRCPFDRGARLLRMAESRVLFDAAGLEAVEAAYYLFFPGPLKFMRPLERFLGWLPLGAQYYVAARRPRSA